MLSKLRLIVAAGFLACRIDQLRAEVPSNQAQTIQALVFPKPWKPLALLIVEFKSVAAWLVCRPSRELGPRRSSFEVALAGRCRARVSLRESSGADEQDYSCTECLLREAERRQLQETRNVERLERRLAKMKASHVGDESTRQRKSVVNADDLPENYVLTPLEAVKGLIHAFNSRDPAAVASFLTDDCEYNDMIFGQSIVCRGKSDFAEALTRHPAFLGSVLFGKLPLVKTMPNLTIEPYDVDGIIEGADAVSVKWRAKLGDFRLPVGTGISQVFTDPAQGGRIRHVSDLCEAPWRIVGMVSWPFYKGLQVYRSVFWSTVKEVKEGASDPKETISQLLKSDEEQNAEREFLKSAGGVWADGVVNAEEHEYLDQQAQQLGLSEAKQEELFLVAKDQYYERYYEASEEQYLESVGRASEP